MPKKKRHFYNGIHYHIDRDKQIVELTPDFAAKLNRHTKLYLEDPTAFTWPKFKKIGGSSFGSIVGLNPHFHSDFQASVNIMGLGHAIYDEKYVNAGNKTEPLIINQITKEKGTDHDWVSYDGPTYGYDVFNGEVYGIRKMEHFSGLPDLVDHTEEIVYEIKTTGAKNKANWDKYGPPKYYQAQVGLYAKLMGYKKAIIAACFLEPGDYDKPEDVDVSQRQLTYYEVDMKWQEDSFFGLLYKARDWREQIIMDAASFRYDTTNADDMRLLEWLACETEAEADAWEQKHYAKFI